MDELRSFFNNPCPSSAQMVKLRAPLTGGFRITKDDPSIELNRREEHRHAVISSGKNYVHEVKQRETELYMKNELSRRDSGSLSAGMESLEQLSSWNMSQQNIGQLTDEAMMEVYNKYSFQMKEDTNNLAINEYKQQILDRIRGFPVVIIEGPTGCGKTTQVPQWILDDSYQNRRPCKIVVTQPRRIAAISIAKRVAQERGWDLGGLVGYQVGLECKITVDTRIQYVTTGVLLQKLVVAKTMCEYTHIILDEVHERGQDMDFLLLVVKKLLYTVSPGVKVVLMSATFNRQAFADYFLIPTPMGPQKSLCINIVKKNPMFTVKTFYLNHLNKFGSVLQKATPRDGEPCITPEMHHLVIKLINAFEQIDKQEDNYTNRSEADLPSVLIFLPGINEIEELYASLTDVALRTKVADAACARYKWWVLPLHSSITADEQVRVFQRAPPGTRKIILATNIAESSITVPDIKYVIDFCLMKVLVTDEDTNFTTLRMCWAAKNNCEQRAGRAGRVRDGRVYRLVTDKFYNSLQQECDPEIVRCPLERLVLLAKMLDMGKPSDILALAMDPPDLSNISRTILVLKEIGALKKTVDNEWSSVDGDITYLGRIMAKLPINVQASKLIVLGYIYGCFDETIIMAAAMSVRNIFNTPFRERLNAYNSKLTWADGSTSDSIALLNVYKVWSHLRQQQQFGAAGSEAQWARRFYVQARALRELGLLVRELRARLAREGLDAGAAAPSPWARHELPLALKIILAGAFYPQYFVQVSQDESRERDAVRILNGLDPRNTVYLTNFPDNQPGEIYATSIKKVIRQQTGDEPRVTFDNNSRKVYLTFDNGTHMSRQDKDNSGDPTIPGQVALPVYKCVKFRQTRLDVRIPMLPVDKAQELAATLKMEKMDLKMEMMVPRLPDVNDTHLPLKISHIIDVGKFWAQYDDASTAGELRAIAAALNARPLLAPTHALAPADLLAAPYADAAGTAVHRARVLRILPRDMVEVLFIDYGTLGRVHSRSLRVLPAEAAAAGPLAMRCRLAALAPAPLLQHRGGYTSQAMRYFAELVAKGHLIAKVYSVVHGVVSIELLGERGQLNINQELIKRGFAVTAEESYDSKLNHDLRETANELDLAQIRAYNKEQTEMAYDHLRELDPPNVKECTTDVCLKGPFSPLETSVHTLMYASREKQVQIEWNSVNSVLLDTDPQLEYERLVVAAEVGQSENCGRLMLRHTTLMPNIPALPAIISLLYCPVAELRRDSSCTRYASVLCGLGSDEHAAPRFPEHDLLVNIDADLDVDDIGLINRIRHLTDYMIYCADGQDMPTADDEFRPQIPGIIRKDLMQLLMRRRRARGVQAVARAWQWRSAPEDELLEMATPALADRAVLFALHAPLDLRPLPRDQLLQLKQDNDHLKLLVSKTPVSSKAEMSCKLCNTGSMPLHAMRIHLYSNAHKEKEEDFRIFQS